MILTYICIYIGTNFYYKDVQLTDAMSGCEVTFITLSGDRALGKRMCDGSSE
jgi:hypothetical protein